MCVSAQSCSALFELMTVTCQIPESEVRLLSPWDFPGMNTGVGCYFLHQGIFPTQGSNPHFLHWLVDPLALSHLGISVFFIAEANPKG